MKHWNWKRLIRKIILLVAAVSLLLCAAVFQPFVHVFSSAEVWSKPEHRIKQSIEQVLEKTKLSGKDYKLLWEQTGLGPAAIDGIRKRPDYKIEDILLFQDCFLCDAKTECCSSSLFTKQDKVVMAEGQQVPMAELKDGDILISFSSHSLGWQHGHAALVVDGKRLMALEAIMPGTSSKVRSCRYWNTYSNFMILRLRGASEEERAAIAEFARENLVGVPYSLASGFFGEREQADAKEMTAQCAYLIWYAFMRFGYDLDSDGGRLVTVADLQESPLLEIVQVFGM